MAASARALLAGLLARLDAQQLTSDDVLALSMVSMLVEKHKSGIADPSVDSDALRYLALGWFVDSMSRSETKSPKIEN